MKPFQLDQFETALNCLARNAFIKLILFVSVTLWNDLFGNRLKLINLNLFNLINFNLLQPDKLETAFQVLNILKRHLRYDKTDFEEALIHQNHQKEQVTVMCCLFNQNSGEVPEVYRGPNIDDRSLRGTLLNSRPVSSFCCGCPMLPSRSFNTSGTTTQVVLVQARL